MGSEFTYKNLLDLNDPGRAYNSPLAVICHIDMNAFFAQYEQNRLNLTSKDPVVCLQWNSLIAVSYAAREYGINRLDSLQSAKMKCPNLIPAHTAVFKKGEPTWKYTDYKPSPVNHKVSLDPYRRESRKMLRVFRAFCDLVEKASVDESFLDFGRLVFARIMEACPKLLGDMRHTSDRLPSVEEVWHEPAHWEGTVIEKEGYPTEVNDWDDVVIMIGSQLAEELRGILKRDLNYTTSAGVARVKTLAKLASGYKKPDAQTIVRTSMIPEFLSMFNITDFWSMGGKVGKYIVSQLDCEDESKNIGFIRDSFSKADLALKFDNNRELAENVYNIVRGDLRSPLSSRIAVKSMMSNKNFRGGSVSKTTDFYPWFEVFIGDLVLRLQELDEEDQSIRRPTRLSLSVHANSISRSKQCTFQPIKSYEDITRKMKTLAHGLLKDLEQSWQSDPIAPKMYPCTTASLVISGFEQFDGFNRLDDLMGNAKKRKRSVSLPPPPFSSSEESSTPARTLKCDSEDYTCLECGKTMPRSDETEHRDYHFALALDSQYNVHAETSYGERLLMERRRDQSNPDKKTKVKKQKHLKGQSTLPF